MALANPKADVLLAMTLEVSKSTRIHGKRINVLTAPVKVSIENKVS